MDMQEMSLSIAPVAVTSANSAVPSKPQNQRSRGACHTCRRRRRKCDETRPSCQACERKKVPCGGYATQLRWGSGIASRGRFAGASMPVQEALPVPVKGRKRDTPGRQHDNLRSPSLSGEGTEKRVTVFTTAASTPEDDFASMQNISDKYLDPPASISSRTPEDLKLFEEFIACGHFILFSTRADESPIAPLFPQLVRYSDALFAVCITLQLWISEHQTERFYRYNNAALEQYATALTRNDGKLNAGIMAAGLLLCTIGLLQGTPWTIHLHCMDQVYDLRGILDRSECLPRDTRDFFEVAGIMDLPTHTIGRRTPSLMLWPRLRQCQEICGGRKLPGIEPTTGLPRSLLDLLSASESQNAEEDFLSWPGEAGQYLQCHLWEATRFAGMLMARRWRRHMRQICTSSIPLPSSQILVIRAMASLDALQRMLPQASDHRSLVVNALLYPIFAIGLEFEVLETKPEMKETLTHIYNEYVDDGRCENAIHAWKIVEEVWSSGSADFDVFKLAKSREIEIALF